MRVCEIDGCDRKHYGRGWCVLHYNRWASHGDPTITTRDRSPDPICSVDDCERDRFSLGLCQPHWYRLKKFGAPLLGPSMETLTVEQRYWTKVAKGDPDQCWLWTCYLDEAGYGRLSVNGVPLLAHRLAYEFHHGAIDPDLDVDHLCFTRACVNVRHLEQVTRSENVKRMHARAKADA